MSRKHAPIPPSERTTVANEIGWARVALEREGRKPVTVRLSPALWDLFRPIWGNSEIKALVGIRAELDEDVERFEIRCRK